MSAKDVLISGSPCEETVTKAVYRFKVWNELENRDLVRFPRPCKGRIPNFEDCTIAAGKLSSEDVFKEAQVIMVNVDKPQEAVRFMTLEAGKTLLVPMVRMARLADGLMTKICLPDNANRIDLRTACKRRGIDIYGKTISIDEKIHIDMIVIGSVAVSKEGHHIGKGRGFSDLEYAVLAANGAVTKDTLIVTTVHDVQIFDTLPHQLFEHFDVPVDLIVTPTQIVKVSPRLPRPETILWNLISDRRLQQFPLLKTLRNKEIENGNECPLKEVDSEPEERSRPYYRPNFSYRRPFYQRQRREQSQSGSQKDSPVRDQSRRTRTFRRRQQVNDTGNAVITNGPKEQRPNKEDNKGDNKINEENKENQEHKPLRKRQKRFPRNRIRVDFSVKIGNIGSTVRVRDLKAALMEKGVRPRTIIWQGSRGFALLQFAKMKTEPKQPTAVDDVIASLQGLKVKHETNKDKVKETVLSVEPAKPISRIENAGVTAV